MSPTRRKYIPPEKRRCRICGCTEARGCPGGCSWVDVDLCSCCFEVLVKLKAKARRQRFPASTFNCYLSGAADAIREYRKQFLV